MIRFELSYFEVWIALVGYVIGYVYAWRKCRMKYDKRDA